MCRRAETAWISQRISAANAETPQPTANDSLSGLMLQCHEAMSGYAHLLGLDLEASPWINCHRDQVLGPGSVHVL